MASTVKNRIPCLRKGNKGGSATQVTEINKLNQNTEKVNEVSRTHIPLKALMNDSFEKCEI